jgi:hypothetical protein
MLIYYDAQQDADSGQWFFIVFSGPQQDVYESDPGFDSEQEACEAAVRWITENLSDTTAAD